MKAKINYKSKKTIIIIAIAVVLLIAAITGTVAFIKGNNNAAAAMENTEVTEPANNGNDSNNNGGVENSNTPNTDNPEQIPTIDENQNSTTPAQNGNTTTNSGTTNQGTTTGTTTGNTGTTNREYTQTTTVITENPWKTEDITWTPISLNARTATAELPNLDIEKIAYVHGKSTKDLQVSPAVQKGEIITYTINITNNGEKDTLTLRTEDAIPEGTKLVDNSITQDGKFENNKITWKIKIKAKEMITLSFKVEVVEDEITLIENQAKVDGEPTNITETPVIRTLKDAKIVTKIEKEEILEDNRAAKPGEIIRYQVKVINDSDKDVNVEKITDEIPEGTTLLPGTITDNGSEENGVITWENIFVEKNTTKTVSFDVKVNKYIDRDNGEKEIVKFVHNQAKVNDIPTNDVPTDVINIETVKYNNPTKDTVLHELDEITYTLTSTNIGKTAGSVVVADTVPEGTTLVGNVKLEGDLKDYTEDDLRNGITVALEPGESRSITFTVSINPFNKNDKDAKKEGNKLTKVIRNLTATQDWEPINETENPVEKEYKSVKITKHFEDNRNREGKRPNKVKVGLYSKDNLNDAILTADLDDSNGWGYTFENLDKFDINTKQPIEYTIKEIDLSDDYKAEVSIVQEGDNAELKLTNTLKYENFKREITVNKKWIDPEGITSHGAITIELYRNDDLDNPLTTQQIKNNEKSTTFTNLLKYDSQGNEYSYIIKERNVEKYTSDVPENGINVEFVNDSATVTVNITNTRNQEYYVSISGVKTWIDPDASKRPEVTIQLYINGELYDTKTLVDNKYEFTNLPKYKTEDWTKADSAYVLDKNGKLQLNEYTVKEVFEEDNYTSNIPEDGVKAIFNKDKAVVNITNTIKQEYVTVKGEKTWEGTPEGWNLPTVKIQLLRNGTPLSDRVATLGNGNWKYSFENLEKYDANGNIYKYSIKEEPINDYQTTYTPNDGKAIFNEENVATINVKNTYHQDITGTIITSNATEKSAPVDVVFVLDISSSMLDKGTTSKKNLDDNKAIEMVNAVNSAITELMKNENNRVAIELFNSYTQDLLPLGHYEAKESNKYLKYVHDTNNNRGKIVLNIKNKNGSGTIYNNANGGEDNYHVGTFTQGGITEGAKLLKGPQTVDGINSVPVMILVTDGDPTHYIDGNGVKQPTKINGWGILRYVTSDYYKYTMDAIVKAKDSITNRYKYADNKYSNPCKFYTIGINMKGAMAKALLNPTKANIENLNKNDNDINDEIHGDYAPNYYNNQRKDLYNKVKGKNYNYTDEAFTNNMTQEGMKNAFTKIIKDNTYSYKNLEPVDSRDRVITLDGINESGKSKIKITGTDKSGKTVNINKEFATFEAARKQYNNSNNIPYIEGNKVYITNLKSGNIEITYSK